jgi:hypothetical protein
MKVEAGDELAAAGPDSTRHVRIGTSSSSEAPTEQFLTEFCDAVAHAIHDRRMAIAINALGLPAVALPVSVTERLSLFRWPGRSVLFPFSPEPGPGGSPSWLPDILNRIQFPKDRKSRVTKPFAIPRPGRRLKSRRRAIRP